MTKDKKHGEAKKKARGVVSAEKGRAYDELYHRLDTKEDENDVYKMVKLYERKTGDLNQVKCIKDGAGAGAGLLLVKYDEIKNRRRDYFDGCSMVGMTVLCQS